MHNALRNRLVKRPLVNELQRYKRKQSRSFSKILIIVAIIVCLYFLFFFMSRVDVKDGYSKTVDSMSLQNTLEKFTIKTINDSGNTILPKDMNPLSSSTTKNSPSDKVTPPTTTYHMVFSTDCSPFQRWQSYLLFYHAMKVKQPGKVTRIASGCTEEESIEESKWHDDFIRSQMSKDFGLHLTPHFSAVKDEIGNDTGKDYKFFNKPFGLRHWMENSKDTGFNDSSSSGSVIDDLIIILIDPDMVLTRPITRDFSNDEETITLGIFADGKKQNVESGSPFAQPYGFGRAWQHLDINKIAGKTSPANKVSKQDSNQHYPVGPPYLATARDMYQIAVNWSDFVPKVHQQHPHLLAEMFAFCIAAAHVKLPFQLINSLMVSNTEVDDEGWDLLDDISDHEMCAFAKNAAAATSNDKARSLPSTLHFCQRYMLDKWFFGKRRLPKDFFSCKKPLLKQPPDNLGELYNYRIPPPARKGGDGGKKKILKKKQVKRETFMLCYLTQAMNDASIFYKERHCENQEVDRVPTMDLWKE